jgi:hypothetical protein
VAVAIGTKGLGSGVALGRDQSWGGRETSKVAYGNNSVNGSVNEQESEHARHNSPDSRWVGL